MLLVCVHMAGCASVEPGVGKPQSVGKPPMERAENVTQQPVQPRHAVSQPPGYPAYSAPPPAPSQRQVPAPPVPQPTAPAFPTPPAPISTCDAGGCWNTNAKRYNGGAGGVYLDNRGKLCQRQGAWMQCF